MGNCSTYCHCNKPPAEQNELQTDALGPAKKNTRSANSVPPLKSIVKMQALFRGALLRKHMVRHGFVVKRHHLRGFSNEPSPEVPQIYYNSYTGVEERDEYYFKNGAIYKGQWRGNVRHGFGVQTWPDGAKYEGYWKNNKAEGKGTFWHVDGDIYEGDWKDDKANGYGIYTHVNGARYEGNWSDDLQHGFGVETWNDGSRYEGFYEEGKKQGRGKYVWSDGSSYDGHWSDNKING